MVDDYNCLIPKRSKYIKCQYYQKQKESWSSGIYHKLLPKSVCVFPTQVLSPLVNLDENNVLKMDEYQWLCDSIWLQNKSLKNFQYLLVYVIIDYGVLHFPLNK